MASDEQMSLHERRKYLRIMRDAYHRAKPTERGRLLDAMATATGLNRKTLIRLMRSDLQRQPRRRQRGKTYQRDMDQALRVIAESYDYLCAERLTPNLLPLAEQLAAHREWRLTESLRQQLAHISPATVYRRLAQFRQDEPQLRRRAPRPPASVIQSIPMRRIPWNERAPGHFEVDLVHPAGASADGQYVHTLQMIDVTTGWSERAAVLGRAYLVMEDGFRRCQARLPFPVLELHPDNGAEFLNQLMFAFWHKQPQIPQFSRSRPYQKNDNRFVEQKNHSLVRTSLGHGRLDTVAQTNQLNQLYDRLWLYNNFFQPVLRLAEKTVTRAAGELVIKRRFDQPQTPFDRLCASRVLPPECQQALEQLRQQTNPRQLRREIYDRIDQLLSRPNARPGQTEPVRQTLLPAGRWTALPCWQSTCQAPTSHPARSGRMSISLWGLPAGQAQPNGQTQVGLAYPTAAGAALGSLSSVALSSASASTTLPHASHSKGARHPQ